MPPNVVVGRTTFTTNAGTPDCQEAAETKATSGVRTGSPDPKWIDSPRTADPRRVSLAKAFSSFVREDANGPAKASPGETLLHSPSISSQRTSGIASGASLEFPSAGVAMLLVLLPQVHPLPLESRPPGVVAVGVVDERRDHAVQRNRPVRRVEVFLERALLIFEHVPRLLASRGVLVGRLHVRPPLLLED